MRSWHKWRARLKITILPPLHSALSDGRGSDGALGGIETACLELGDALVDRGHQVRIAGRFANHRKAQAMDWAQLAASDGDALIACNDARVLHAGGFQTRVFWSHNPLAVEKAIRKKQFAPIWMHRPHAVFGSHGGHLTPIKVSHPKRHSAGRHRAL